MIICSPHVGVAPESSSGGEVYEREVLKHLALLGAEIELILPARAPVWSDIANWHVCRTPLSKGFRWYVSNVVFPPYIKRLYDRRPFDLLRVHSLRFVGPAALWARRRYRLPVPVVAHHHHLDANWLNPVIERRVIDACDLLVTVSEFSRRQLASDLGVRTDHVAVVYDGIGKEFEPQPKDEKLAARLGIRGVKTLLFLGGLKPRKNLGLLLEAMRALVAEMGDQVQLVIAGKGSEERTLRRRATSWGIANRVVFTGYVRERDKVGLYNLADVYVLPSSLEGFGMTAAEAMSCGKPVVATAVGSLPEVIVHGETGFLVPPGDAGLMARHVITLLGDEGLAQRFGRAGRRRVDERFRWDMIAAQLLELYEDLI